MQSDTIERQTEFELAKVEMRLSLLKEVKQKNKSRQKKHFG